MAITSTDMVSDIKEALADRDESFARELLRDYEGALSNKQKQQVREAFDEYRLVEK